MKFNKLFERLLSVQEREGPLEVPVIAGTSTQDYMLGGAGTLLKQLPGCGNLKLVQACAASRVPDWGALAIKAQACWRPCWVSEGY